MDMLVERLQVYERKNKLLPDRIFVYRDGVSEVSIHSSFSFVIVSLMKPVLSRVNSTL